MSKTYEVNNFCHGLEMLGGSLKISDHKMVYVFVFPSLSLPPPLPLETLILKWR